VLSTGLASGFTASFDATNGIVTVVPEPNAALFGSLGLLALLRRRRA
jgi:MYXO-CTERM domain-containing protein